MFLHILIKKLKRDSNTPKYSLFEYCVQELQGFKAWVDALKTTGVLVLKWGTSQIIMRSSFKAEGITLGTCVNLVPLPWLLLQFAFGDFGRQ